MVANVPTSQKWKRNPPYHRHILPGKFVDLIPLSVIWQHCVMAYTLFHRLCIKEAFGNLFQSLLVRCPVHEAPCEFYHFIFFNGACLDRLHHLFLSLHHLMFQKLRRAHSWTYASKYSCFTSLVKNHHNLTWSTILLWFSVITCKLQNFFLFCALQTSPSLHC